MLDPDLLAAAGPRAGDVMVLLGPASEVGAAATRRRDDLAHAALAPWRELVPRENLVVELVSHRLPGRRRLGARHHPARRPDGRGRPAGRARGRC